MPRTLTVGDLASLHAERAAEIRARLDDFSRVPPGEYFYELAYCLLTPQSSAANAEKVVAVLKERDFLSAGFDPVALLDDRSHYIRFHRTKARRLLRARERYPDIAVRLAAPASTPELRGWLVGNVDGFGWKEASHFLRNIGHRDLAILDRHILRNLVGAGVIGSTPKTLTKKSYLSIEKKFLTFARRTGIPLDELDLLFWSMETGRILK